MYGILESNLQRTADRLGGSATRTNHGYYWTGRERLIGGLFCGPIPVNNNPTVQRAPRTALNAAVHAGIRSTPQHTHLRFLSKGVKPGGVSTIASPNPVTARFAPEELWNYEAGFKSTLADGRVTFNAAVFFMDYEGKQTVSLEPSATAATGFDLVVGNAGAAEISGFEVEGALAVTEELLIRGGYTWLDSEYTDYVSLTNSALTIGLVGDCTLQQTPAGLYLCSVDQSGREMERVPQHNFNISASYTRAVGNGMNFQVDLLAQYQSERGIAVGRRNVFDSWVNVDARIGLQAETLEPVSPTWAR